MGCGPVSRRFLTLRDSFWTILTLRGSFWTILTLRGSFWTFLTLRGSFLTFSKVVGVGPPRFESCGGPDPHDPHGGYANGLGWELSVLGGNCPSWVGIVRLGWELSVLGRNFPF